jgi:DNA-binding transcriptional MerR regulator
MPVNIEGNLYYQTSETARQAGISRSTLLRWLDKGVIKDTSRRDRRGWRLFSQYEVKEVISEAHKFQSEWERHGKR